jgi:hypothetical protein
MKRAKLTSRYGSAPMYLSDVNSHLNDVEIEVDEEIVSKLIENSSFLIGKYCQIGIVFVT